MTALDPGNDIKPLGYYQGYSPPILKSARYLPEPPIPISAVLIRASTQHVEASFREFSKRWREETGGLSSATQILSNKYYLKTIALGKPVIPYILEALRQEAVPWFSALRALTGRDDIGTEHAGKFRKIANAWIEWGEQNGYIKTAPLS